MQQRLASLRDEPLAFAHRGARAHARENTIEAFGLALRLGANGLETDAWLSRDGVVILDHDGIVRRRLRRRPLSRFERSALPRHMPTLAELVDHLGGNFDLSIDVKDPRGFVSIARVVRDTDLDPSRVWLCHPDRSLLIEHRRNLEGFRLVNSTRLKYVSEGLEKRVADLADSGIDAINMHHTDWNGGHVAMCHRFGRFALAWDVQYEDRLATLLRMGIDGMFSDHVDRMVAAYTAEIGHAPRR